MYTGKAQHHMSRQKQFTARHAGDFKTQSSCGMLAHKVGWQLVCCEGGLVDRQAGRDGRRVNQRPEDPAHNAGPACEMAAALRKEALRTVQVRVPMGGRGADRVWLCSGIGLQQVVSWRIVRVWAARHLSALDLSTGKSSRPPGRPRVAWIVGYFESPGS